jgi:hypothetical protein
VQVVDPKKRLTTQQILDHPWVSGKCDLSLAPLTKAISGLRKFNARRKVCARAVSSAFKSLFRVVPSYSSFSLLLCGAVVETLVSAAVSMCCVLSARTLVVCV